jgi:hypothetical protein
MLITAFFKRRMGTKTRAACPTPSQVGTTQRAGQHVQAWCLAAAAVPAPRQFPTRLAVCTALGAVQRGCVCAGLTSCRCVTPQVAQMDADTEQVEVASSADEEELKQAALDHLDATVISYVLVCARHTQSCAVLRYATLCCAVRHSSINTTAWLHGMS